LIKSEALIADWKKKKMQGDRKEMKQINQGLKERTRKGHNSFWVKERKCLNPLT
jgi:hypothetical protein